MARSTTPPTTPTGEQASVAAIEHAAAQARPVYDWAALESPRPMPNRVTVSSIKVNVLETVPAPIRERAEKSLAINTARVAAKANSTAERPRIDYHWDLQPVPDKEMGALFVKLITKYAKYRPADKLIPHAESESPAGQATARCGDVQHYCTAQDGSITACAGTHPGAYLGVRYSVRPHERRNDNSRLPGTA